MEKICLSYDTIELTTSGGILMSGLTSIVEELNGEFEVTKYFKSDYEELKTILTQHKQSSYIDGGYRFEYKNMWYIMRPDLSVKFYEFSFEDCDKRFIISLGKERGVRVKISSLALHKYSWESLLEHMQEYLSPFGILDIMKLRVSKVALALDFNIDTKYFKPVEILSNIYSKYKSPKIKPVYTENNGYETIHVGGDRYTFRIYNKALETYVNKKDYLKYSYYLNLFRLSNVNEIEYLDREKQIFRYEYELKRSLMFDTGIDLNQLGFPVHGINRIDTLSDLSMNKIKLFVYYAWNHRRFDEEKLNDFFLKSLGLEFVKNCKEVNTDYIEFMSNVSNENDIEKDTYYPDILQQSITRIENVMIGYIASYKHIHEVRNSSQLSKQGHFNDEMFKSMECSDLKKLINYVIDTRFDDIEESKKKKQKRL